MVNLIFQGSRRGNRRHEMINKVLLSGNYTKIKASLIQTLLRRPHENNPEETNKKLCFRIYLKLSIRIMISNVSNGRNTIFRFTAAKPWAV